MVQVKGTCGHCKSGLDDHPSCLSCTGCSQDASCSVCSAWDEYTWRTLSKRRTYKSRVEKRRSRSSRSVSSYGDPRSESEEGSSSPSRSRPGSRRGAPRHVSRREDSPLARYPQGRSPSLSGSLDSEVGRRRPTRERSPDPPRGSSVIATDVSSEPRPASSLLASSSGGIPSCLAPLSESGSTGHLAGHGSGPSSFLVGAGTSLPSTVPTGLLASQGAFPMAGPSTDHVVGPTTGQALCPVTGPWVGPDSGHMYGHMTGHMSGPVI